MSHMLNITDSQTGDGDEDPVTKSLVKVSLLVVMALAHR